jgi:hypothetical protein
MQAAVDKYTPIFYFHKDEKYYVSSIPWTLEKSNLVRYDTWPGVQWTDGKIVETKVTPKVLFDYSEKNHQGQTGIKTLYIELKKELFDKALFGQKDELDKVPVYAYVKEREDRYIIYYIIYFPFNEGKNVMYLQQAGDHEGDIEHLTVEVSKKDNTLIRVHYGAHGTADGRWVAGKDVPMEDGRIVAFVGKGGHGLYPTEGVAIRLGGVANDFMGKDVVWKPKVEIIKSRDQPGFDVEKDGWIHFAGRWGYDGVGSLNDKGWFQWGDKEEKDLNPPPLYPPVSRTYFNIGVYSFILAIMVAITGLAWWQTKLRPQNYFTIVGTTILILALVVKFVIKKVA